MKVAVSWRSTGSQGVVVMAVMEALLGVDVAEDSPGQVCRGERVGIPAQAPHLG